MHTNQGVEASVWIIWQHFPRDWYQVFFCLSHNMCHINHFYAQHLFTVVIQNILCKFFKTFLFCQ